MARLDYNGEVSKKMPSETAGAGQGGAPRSREGCKKARGVAAHWRGGAGLVGRSALCIIIPRSFRGVVSQLARRASPCSRPGKARLAMASYAMLLL